MKLNVGNILVLLTEMTPDVDWQASFNRRTKLFMFRGYMQETNMRIARFLPASYYQDIQIDLKIHEQALAEDFAHSFDLID
jgi:hypothetical protein